MATRGWLVRVTLLWCVVIVAPLLRAHPSIAVAAQSTAYHPAKLAAALWHDHGTVPFQKRTHRKHNVHRGMLHPNLITSTATSLTVSHPDFSDMSDMATNGSAGQSGTALQLTPSANYTQGSAYAKARIDVTQSFHTQFQLTICCSTSGQGDGMTFNLQNSSSGLNALGSQGGGLGFGGISPSVGVEFDTYQNTDNRDPNSNHIGILTNGNTASYVAVATPSFGMYGSTFNVWIDYAASSHALQVFADPGSTKPASPVVSASVDIASIVGDAAYAGFTASTGYYDELHQVNSWQLTGAPGGVPTSSTNGPPTGTQQQTAPSTCSPVNCATGDFWHTFGDITIPGRGMALDFSHTYNSLLASQDSPLGFGWTDSYNMFLSTDTSGVVTVHEEGGSTVNFTPNGSTYQAPSRVLATLVANGDGTLTFTRFRTQEKYVFSAPTQTVLGQLLKEVDRNGYTTTLTYSNGQLSSITDPAGRALSVAYNTSNRIASISDSASRSASFGYDGSGNLTDVTDVNLGHWHFTYDANHLLLTMEDPRQYALSGALSTGPVVVNVFDASARVTSQTDPMNRTTKFAYVQNSDGSQTTTITDPKGYVENEVYRDNELLTDTAGVGTPQAASWSYTYDPYTLGVTSTTDPNQHAWSATWDAHGNQLTQTDPLQHQTLYTYDTLNDLTSITEPNDAGTSTKTTLSYDSVGNLLSISRPLVGASQTATTTYTYGDTSHPGDVTKMTDPNQHGTSFGYDATGDLTSITDAMGDKSTYIYDTVGRMTSEVSPKGNVSGANPATYTTTFGFNAFGDTTSVTDPNQHQTSYGYDPNRNLTSVKDARLNTTTYSYDNDNELTGIGYPDQTSEGKSYDANGNLQSQADGLNRSTQYGYDPLNRHISKTDPLNRTWSYGYDGAGNLKTVSDPTTPTGRVTTYGYDNADRLTSVNYSDGTTPNVTNIGYDTDGQRISMTDAKTGTSTYTYDSLHRLTQSKDGAGKIVGYGYNLGGNLTTLTYPDNTQVTRMYDAADRMTQITDWSQNSTTFAYDQNSNLTTQTYPNGTSAAFSYDPADQLTQIANNNGTSPLWTFGYTRDQNNQLATASDPIANQSYSYSYDALNRLSHAGISGPFGYDAASELKSTYRPDGSASDKMTLSYDNASQLTNITGIEWLCLQGQPCGNHTVHNINFSYNPNGDRTQQTDTVPNTTTSYSYDQADRLTGLSTGTTTASYVYNGDGLRMSKTVGTTSEAFVWDLAEGLPTVVQDGSTKYVTGPSGLPLEEVNGNTVLYYYQDQLGSTRGLLDKNGKTQATYTYDEYGNTTAMTGSVTNPFQYAGQYTDSESGLQYLRARYYDPNTQQFLTVDPIADQTGQPYAYAGDNPVNGVDPSGLCGHDNSIRKPPPCIGTVFLGSHGTAVVTFTRNMKYGTTPSGKFAWHFQFTPNYKRVLQHYNAYAITVWIDDAKVNGRSVQSPYPPSARHIQYYDYNFHASLGNYNYVGSKGQGTLNKGDVVSLRWRWYAPIHVANATGNIHGWFPVSCTVN